MKHLMLGLETLSNDSGAAIIQIGACVIEVQPNKVYHKKGEFCRNITFQSAIEWGGKVNASTLEWWFKQPNEVKESILKNQVSIQNALTDFVDFIGETNSDLFWAHATFDFPVLAATYARTPLKCPIPFRKMRDLRTIEEFAGDKIEWEERTGLHHNALDDAEWQMKHLLKMLDVMGHGS